MYSKVRYTIVLGSIWLCIVAGGLFYWKFTQQRELEGLRKIQKEVANLPALIKETDSLATRYQNLQMDYASRKKEIPRSDILSETYAYVIRGVEQALDMKLDMKFVGTEDFGEWGYNKYSLLQLEGRFASIYKFIYFLENGRGLYKISGLNLTREESAGEQTREGRRSIKCDMELHAYYSKISELGTSSSAKALPAPPTPFNLFYPLVVGVVTKIVGQGEIDADAVEVTAVFSEKAFVRYKNTFFVLQLGDTVRNGHVSGIDATQASVEFTLERGGVIRKVEKKIQFGKGK